MIGTILTFAIILVVFFISGTTSMIVAVDNDDPKFLMAYILIVSVLIGVFVIYFLVTRGILTWI